MLHDVDFKPCASGHVLEPAIALVAIEPLIAPTGDEQIGAAVAVKIASRHAHCIARTRRERLLGDFVKMPTSSISKKPTWRIGFSRGRVDRPAVAKIDVEKPVAVGIEESHAASHDFREVMAAARPVLKLEGDSRLGGDLFKGDRRVCWPFRFIAATALRGTKSCAEGDC